MVERGLRERIIEEYRIYIGPIVGNESELAEKLATGLDNILGHELYGLPTAEHGIDYSYLGSEVKDGKQYTVGQILDMPIDEFVRTHSRLGTGASITRYFNAMERNFFPFKRSELDKEKPMTVRDAIAVPKGQALHINNIGETTITNVDEFLQSNYEISLGMQL